MALIPGSVRVGGFIAPTDDTDVYASHDAIYGKGGHREVADTAARDAITGARRREGMMTYVIDLQKFYYLKGGTSNANWTEWTGGGGTSAGGPSIYWNIIAGETVTVGERIQYGVFNRFQLDGTLTLGDGAELVVHL